MGQSLTSFWCRTGSLCLLHLIRLFRFFESEFVVNRSLGLTAVLTKLVLCSSPSKEGKTKSGKRDAFHDFENKTSDAWDDGDDDLFPMANVQMSLRDVHSSARAVLENHSRQLAGKSSSSSNKPNNTHSFRDIDEGTSKLIQITTVGLFKFNHCALLTDLNI